MEIKSPYFCPGCKENWDGRYSLFHTCETCGRIVRVKQKR